MKENSKVLSSAIILPRKCSIATFTSDLLAAVAAAHSESQCFSVAVNDIKGGYEYPEAVRFEIEEQDFCGSPSPSRERAHSWLLSSWPI